MTFHYERVASVARNDDTLYPDSGPSIVYGPSTPTQEDNPFSLDSTQNSSGSITASAEAGKFITHDLRSTPRNPIPHCQRLLDAATAMITAGANVVSNKDQAQSDNSEIHDLEDDSQTHLPSQILEVSIEESQSLLAPAADESQTQIPQPLPTKRSRGRPKGTHAITTASESLPELWCDCPLVYPDASEIAASLQDPGKTSTKVSNGIRQPVTTFPLIQKLCTKIYQAIQTIYNPKGLTKNVTRGRESLVAMILLARKRTDVTTLHPFFHKYAKDGQVYVLVNDPINSGINISIKLFQNSIVDMLRKARTTRTCNDGLRLALTMLDSKYRDAIASIMTNRKERKHSDISGDYVLHFFEQLLVESFQNPSYQPPQVPNHLFGEIDPDELSTWDPNDPKIFEVDRSAAWLVDTWKQYVRRKYKAALDRWNKETGGGNGQAWSFVNFCDRDARWLVVVFLKDKEANFLLGANAGGRMPIHLQMECGFEPSTEISSLESSGSNDEPPTTCTGPKTKRTVLEEEQLATKKLKSEMTTTFAMITSLCKDKKEAMKDPRTEVFEQVMKMNQAINDSAAMSTMSPNTREMYMSSLQLQRKRLIERMSELVQNNASNN